MATYKSDLKTKMEKAIANGKKFDHLVDEFRSQNLKNAGVRREDATVKAAAARTLIGHWVDSFTAMYGDAVMDPKRSREVVLAMTYRDAHLERISALLVYRTSLWQI